MDSDFNSGGGAEVVYTCGGMYDKILVDERYLI